MMVHNQRLLPTINFDSRPVYPKHTHQSHKGRQSSCLKTILPAYRMTIKQTAVLEQNNSCSKSI